MKVEPFTVLFSELVSEFCMVKYAPPPRYAAELLVNCESMILPLDPDQSTAPPSPPVVFVLSVPNAWLFVKFEFLISPVLPLQ